VWGSDIEVNVYTTNDLYETVPSAQATKRVYNIRIQKAIPMQSFTAATVLKEANTTSTITVGAPYTISTPPLKGKIVIVCEDRNGVEYVSREFDPGYSTNVMNLYLSWDIPHLMFKIQTRWVGYEWPYIENGFKLQIEFQDLHEDPAQCEFRSGTQTPLTGGNPNTGVIFESLTTRPYGQNLMFEPVPMEMLFHDAAKPQVLVKVKGIDGVCPNFNCDYLYSEPTAVITAQSLSGLTVAITGTDLPLTNFKVRFANTECGSAVTVTPGAGSVDISCDLLLPPAAGSWNVELTDSSGLIPVASNVPAISVALTVSSVSPSTDLNQLGGDLLTITGTGFDTKSASTTVTVSDGTTCDIVSTTSTSLQCIPSGFDLSNDDYTVPRVLTVTVNTVENNDRSV